MELSKLTKLTIDETLNQRDNSGDEKFLKASINKQIAKVIVCSRREEELRAKCLLLMAEYDKELKKI